MFFAFYAQGRFDFLPHREIESCIAQMFLKTLSRGLEVQQGIFGGVVAKQFRNKALQRGVLPKMMKQHEPDDGDE